MCGGKRRKGHVNGTKSKGVGQNLPSTRHRRTPASSRHTSLEDVPQEVFLFEVLPHLSAKELVALSVCSTHYKGLAAHPPLWKALFRQRWGHAQQPLFDAAAEIAGGWKQLMKAKHLCDKAAAAAKEPYEKPCCFEIEAQLHALACQAVRQQQSAVASASSLPTPLPLYTISSLPPHNPQFLLTIPPSLSPHTPLSNHKQQSAGALDRLLPSSSTQSNIPTQALPPYYPLPSSPSHSDTSSLSFPPSTPPYPSSMLASASLSSSTPSSSSNNHSGSFVPTASSSPPDYSSFTSSPSPSYPFATPPYYPAHKHIQSSQANCPEQLPPAPPGCQILYLIDGSGSVSDEDFGEMRSFVQSSAHSLCGTLQGSPANKAAGMVGIIQFSHDPHMELQLTPLGNGSALSQALGKMTRINGGTNIEAAFDLASTFISKVPDLPKITGSFGPEYALPPPPPQAPPLPLELQASMGARASSSTASRAAAAGEATPRPGALNQTAVTTAATSSAAASPPATVQAACPVMLPPPRLIILLTDGRVDRYQARCARMAAKRLVQNIPGGCVLAAFGVGRGVDCGELTQIIDVPGSGDAAAKERYLDLFVRDDPGW